MLVKLDKPLEVNSKVNEVLNNIYIENDPNYHYDDHLRYLLSLYKECGGTKLTLSSDAHKAYKYRLDFDKHIKTIYHNKTIGIIIAIRDNKFVMEYCSDDRIYNTTYELI